MRKSVFCVLLVLSLLIGVLPFCASFAEAELSFSRYEEEQFTVLRKGSNDIGVILLQLRLAELGYFIGDVNGVFSDDTEDAVKAFQTKNGFDIDGIATPELQAVLFNAGAISAEGIVFDAYDPEQMDSEEPDQAEQADRNKKECIGNAHTMIFHRPSCSYVKLIKPAHKVVLPSRNEAVLNEYIPCQKCKP